MNKILSISIALIFILSTLSIVSASDAIILGSSPVKDKQTSNDNFQVGNVSDGNIIASLLATKGGIPIKVQTETTTNWTQLWISILFSSFMLFFFFGSMIGEGINNTAIKVFLKRMKKTTGRHVMFIKHTESGLFSSSMIDQKTVSKVAEALNKFDGKDFDVILHTPGGEVFSALYISRMFKNYPGKITSIIPEFSMSGGALLSLSTDEIIMADNACIGPVDCQLGSLFKYGSAKSWNQIVKYKGKRSEDGSIQMAMMGSQYTRSIRTHLENVLDFGLDKKQKKLIADYLTNGNIEHAYPLTSNELINMGIPIKKLEDKKFMNKIIKLISKTSGDGVTYV